MVTSTEVTKMPIDEFGVDWDADALRASKAPYPYTSGSFFEYFKDLIHPQDRVLEVGCQIGSWYPAWRDIVPTIRYEGVDWSKVAIDIATERWPAAKFYNMDAREMKFEDEFDVVFTHTFLQHTSEDLKKIVMPLMYKALKKGGLLIIQENTSYISGGTWFREGWVKFITDLGFTLVLAHDIGGGGTGFVFRK